MNNLKVLYYQTGDYYQLSDEYVLWWSGVCQEPHVSSPFEVQIVRYGYVQERQLKCFLKYIIFVCKKMCGRCHHACENVF